MLHHPVRQKISSTESQSCATLQYYDSQRKIATIWLLEGSLKADVVFLALKKPETCTK